MYFLLYMGGKNVCYCCEDSFTINVQFSIHCILQEPFKYDHGCVLHFKNVGEQTSREDIRVTFCFL